MYRVKTSFSVAHILVDFQLSASQANTRGDVILKCISGTEDSSGVEIRFNFTSLNRGRREEVCEEVPSHKDGWSFYRNTTPPYDCVLTVANPSSGYYQCYGILPDNEYDVSNVQNLTSPEGKSEDKSKSGLSPAIVGVGVITLLGVFTLVVGPIVLVVVCRKCRRRAQVPYQYRRMAVHVPGVQAPDRDGSSDEG